MIRTTRHQKGTPFHKMLFDLGVEFDITISIWQYLGENVTLSDLLNQVMEVPLESNAIIIVLGANATAPTEVDLIPSQNWRYVQVDRDVLGQDEYLVFLAYLPFKSVDTSTKENTDA